MLSATSWHRNHDENKEFWLVYIFILVSIHALKLLTVQEELTMLSATLWHRNHDENKEFWLVYIFILTSIHALK